MSDQEEEPQTIPSLRDTGEAATDEEKALKTTSPKAGYSAGDTEPHEGLTGDEGRVNAEATPDIADDAEEGQTESRRPEATLGHPRGHRSVEARRRDPPDGGRRAPLRRR